MKSIVIIAGKGIKRNFRGEGFAFAGREHVCFRKPAELPRGLAELTLRSLIINLGHFFSIETSRVYDVKTDSDF